MSVPLGEPVCLLCCWNKEAFISSPPKSKQTQLWKPWGLLTYLNKKSSPLFPGNRYITKQQHGFNIGNPDNDLSTHIGSSETPTWLIPLLLPALLRELLCRKLMAYSESSENKIYM